MDQYTYWLLYGGLDLQIPVGIFRVKRNDTGLYVEKFDLAIKTWVKGPASLLRYVIGGEVGAEEVTEQEAKEVMDKLSILK